MSWLRIDDGFPEHPKLIRLGGPAMRWTWLEVLGYCARQQTDGGVPAEISEVVKRANTAFLNKCLAVGLLDENLTENGLSLQVHDWQFYNPADPLKASRQARWRQKRDARVDGDVDAPVDDQNVYRDGPRAQAPARDTVPTPLPQIQKPDQDPASATAVAKDPASAPASLNGHHPAPDEEPGLTPTEAGAVSQ